MYARHLWIWVSHLHFQLVRSLLDATARLNLDPSNANILSNIFGAFDKVNTEAPDGSNRKLGSAAALDFLNSLGG